MAVFPSYSAVGNKECLLDIISNITPKETPMFSTFGKVAVTNTLVEWQTDSLRAAADNKQLSGFTYASGAVVPTVLKNNYTQTFYVGYEVSKTQEAIMHAGRASEVAYQKEKAMKEYALDVEYTIVNHSAKVAYAAATEGEMGGLTYFLTGNYTSGDAIVKDEGTAALTKTLLDDQLQIAWTNGAIEMNSIYAPAKQKRVINDFPATIRKMDVGSDRLSGLVNVYESDFGTLELVLDRRIAESKLYILNDNMWKVGVLRPTVSLTHPEVASSYMFGIEGEMTLICNNPQANTALSNLG